MNDKMARYAVLAGSAYALLYLGVNFGVHGGPIEMMFALLAFGLVAGRHPLGPGAAILAGAWIAVLGLLSLVVGKWPAGEKAFLASYIAAGMLVAYAGLRLRAAQAALASEEASVEAHAAGTDADH